MVLGSYQSFPVVSSKVGAKQYKSCLIVKHTEKAVSKISPRSTLLCSSPQVHIHVHEGICNSFLEDGSVCLLG